MKLSEHEKEQLEQIFIGILYTHYKGSKEKEKFLRVQFEEENPELVVIL
jgi:hypothetical protein